MKGNNIELNKSNKEEPCVLVHAAKGYIFAMKVSSAMHKGIHIHNESIIHNHMIKWGPSIVVDDVSFI